MPSITKSFLSALQKSYQVYLDKGARSPEKIKPAHQWLADHFRTQLGKEYKIYSLRLDDALSREIQAPGRYYNKAIDIGIEYRGKLISGMGFKFVISNYKQNSNNFFENMLGETANIRRSGIVYGSLMVIPALLPYNKKDGTVTKYEQINTHNMEKYLNLFQDKDFPHKPNAVGFVFVNIDYNKGKVSGLTNIDKMGFSEDVATFLKTDIELERFLTDFIKLTKQKASKL